MPRNDLRAALGEVPDHLFAGAVADLVRHKLRRGSAEWVVRTSRQPASPAYVVWPDVIVEHERRVCATITYHIDLPELIRTTKREGSPETLKSLRELVRSRRLRDISRLPADLAA